MSSDTTIKRKYFNNAGVTLSYLDNEQASADLPVVLLHGFTASAKINWLATGWIDKLTQAGKRVLAFDARGHGESDKPHCTDYYPSHIMIEDSLALLSDIGINQADFVGFSMGARMATLIAIHYPEKVNKLIIGGLGINVITGSSNPQPIASALRAKNPNTINNREARRFRRIAEKCGNDLEAMACCITSSRQPINEEMLAKITADTLIIVGNEDSLGGNPHTLQPYITNSQAILINGCNHFNALTHNQFCNTALEFLMD